MVFIMKNKTTNTRVATLVAVDEETAVAMATGVINGIRRAGKMKGIDVYDLPTRDDFSLKRVR